ncbi:hypothetical protein [Achromobacter xylosoxidans]|uniref:hypothetical protein n=1 Tax=Alcaligenes xylosoxydans xylosoxydans TaxID=85698 RepID=UPI0028A5C390|nr:MULTISPECIES: hypothetical protein [Achromobacter]WOB74347.1 hypothetical protein PZA07_02370 [Achromobacter xylosoxidans]
MCEIQANHEAPIIFLRGLEARCRWAAAQDGADPECGDGGACGDSFSQGIQDFEAGRGPNDIPPLLADVRELAAAWRDGWDFACEVEIAKGASCRYCSDADVDVCGFHD